MNIFEHNETNKERKTRKMKKDGGVNVTCTVNHINVIHVESISFLL